jgi:putative transposase
MPRGRRIFLPNVSVHVIQRGNNKTPIFHRPTDYLTLLELLKESAQGYSVAVHGFVLMTNHYHLLVTPDRSDSLPGMMKAVNGGYARYYNTHYQRIGSPWNGRYRGKLVTDERYWLTCLRYIEQNPVRAGMVTRVCDYPWSSYPGIGESSRLDWLVEHSLFHALGDDATSRDAAYRALINELVPPDDPLLKR